MLAGRYWRYLEHPSLPQPQVSALTRRHDQRTRIDREVHSPGRARQNGLAETELKEMIIHLTFYAGWPRAMSAIWMARELLGGRDAQ